MKIEDLLGDLYHEGMSDEEIQKAFDSKYVSASAHEKALQKQKGLIDSYTSQIAEAKKREKARMSEEEAKAAAAQEQADKIQELEKQLKLRDVMSQYLARGFSEADAQTAATALLDGDTDGVLRSEKAFAEQREAALRTQWEKEYRVNPPAGTAGAAVDYSGAIGEASAQGDMASMASLIRQQFEATHKK